MLYVYKQIEQKTYNSILESYVNSGQEPENKFIKDIGQYLVEDQGVIADVRNGNSIIYAAWNGHLETVKYLVEKRVSPCSI